MILTLSSESTTERSANITWPSAFAAVPHSLHCEVRRVPKGWWLRFDFDLRVYPWEPWIASGLYADRDEAACEAADLWAVGFDLAQRHARGEAVETPYQRRCAAWHLSPEFLAAHKAYEEAVLGRAGIDVNAPGWHALRREAMEEVNRSQEALNAAKFEWWAAHGWRGFVT